jgi:hypothetical protein
MADIDERKRLNYFNGLFLKEEEFKAEQNFHLTQQRRHNKYLHTPGIAGDFTEDLKVEGNIGEKTVTISPGMAIDGEGRQIIVTEQDTDLLSFSLPDVAEGTEETCLLIISYPEPETQSDPAVDIDPNAQNNKYIFAKPKVEFILEAEANNNPEDLKIRLARLVIDANGLQAPVDEAVRQAAGTKVPQVGGALNLTGGGVVEGIVDVLSEKPASYPEGGKFFNASCLIFQENTVREIPGNPDDLLGLRNEPSGLIARVGVDPIDNIAAGFKAKNAAIVAIGKGTQDHPVCGIYTFADEEIAGSKALFVDGSIETKGGANCDGRVWNDVSSIEYKEDIATLTLEQALEVLGSLNPVTFIYKDDRNGKTQAGFIAEEVPELVSTSDRKSVSLMTIVGILTKVIQQQQQEIEELKRNLNPN